VSTLKALAYQAQSFLAHPKVVIAALDARMKACYVGVYALSDEKISCIEPDKLCSLEVLPLLYRQYPDAFIIGQELNQDLPIHIAYPCAKEVAEIAMACYQKGDKGILAKALEPCYLRDKVAEKLS